MKYALQKWILLGLLALLTLLSSGCWYCMRLACVNEEGQGNFDGFAAVRKAALEEEYENWLAFSCWFLDARFPPGDEYGYYIYAMIYGPEWAFYVWLVDPLVMQFPADAHNFSGTYDDGIDASGQLIIQSGLTTVPVAPGVFLRAEPGHQLVVIDFPDDPNLVIPEPDELETWFNFTLNFHTLATLPDRK